jgi:hypothetical protein
MMNDECGASYSLLITDYSLLIMNNECGASTHY